MGNPREGDAALGGGTWKKFQGTFNAFNLAVLPLKNKKSMQGADQRRRRRRRRRRNKAKKYGGRGREEEEEEEEEEEDKKRKKDDPSPVISVLVVWRLFVLLVTLLFLRFSVCFLVRFLT